MPNDPNNGDMDEKDATLEIVLAIGGLVLLLGSFVLLLIESM